MVIRNIAIGVIAFVTVSCGETSTTANKEGNDEERFTDSAADEITRQVLRPSDSALVADKGNKNEFRTDYSDVEIEELATSKIDGEWIVDTGSLKFLNTHLVKGDKVIFQDTVKTVVTGWGTIIYNRVVKFYFTEHGSHVYEYFIDLDGFLKLIQYDYRNKDISLKEKPEAVDEIITLEWNNVRQIQLSFNGGQATLKRKNNSSAL